MGGLRGALCPVINRISGVGRLISTERGSGLFDGASGHLTTGRDAILDRVTVTLAIGAVRTRSSLLGSDSREGGS